MFWTLWQVAYAGWVVTPGPWDQAPLRAADQQGETLWVLSGEQLFEHRDGATTGLGSLPPLPEGTNPDLGLGLHGPQAWIVSDSQICSASPGDSEWACQSLTEGYPRVPRFYGGLGVSGGLRGAAWIYREGSWTPFAHSALPDTLAGHNRALYADAQGLFMATRTELIQVSGEEVIVRALPEPLTHTGLLEICAGPSQTPRVVGAGGAWDWLDKAWVPLDFPAAVCGGPWLASEAGEILGPQGVESSPAQVAPLWMGQDWALTPQALLHHDPEQSLAFVERAAQWGVAQQDPGSGALLADLMGSPAPDLLLVDSLGRPRLYENQGERWLERPQAAWADVHWPGAMVACDVDGDGKEEVVFGRLSQERASVEIWRVSPKGQVDSWQARALMPELALVAGTAPQITCLDLDLDGHKDLYLSFLQGPGGWPRPNVLLHNRGYGALQLVELDPNRLGGGSTWTTRALYEDLMGSGRPQLLVTGAWVGSSMWQEEAGLWTQVPKAQAPLDPYQGWMASWAGDLDGDGDLDLLTSADEGFRLQENRGAHWADRGLLLPGNPKTSLNPETLALSDVDLDGDLDIFGQGPAGQPKLLLNQGDWSFQDNTLAAGLLAHPQPTSTQIADVDQDGDADLLLIGQGPNRLYLNRGLGPGASSPVPETWRHRLLRHVVWLPWPETGVRWALLLGVLLLTGWQGRRKRLPLSGRLLWSGGLLLGLVELALLDQGIWARWVWGLAPAATLGTLSLLEASLARTRRLQHIAHFRLEGAIGAGGMGMVYRAWDKKHGRRVALKVLLPEIEALPTARQRFIREATLSMEIQHPHLVSATEHGACTVWREGQPHSSHYLSMELMSSSLRSQMHGPTPPLRAVQLLEQTLMGLQALHQREICHRDIKPENLLLDAQGELKIADLGLALGPNSERLTRTSSLMGTLTYLAPELAQGGQASPQADLYAVGVLGYELLSGQAPHQGQESLELIFSLLHRPPPPLHTLCPELDPGLCAIIDHCMARTPELRPQDCAQVLEALARFARPAEQSVEEMTLPPDQALARNSDA
jgi:hypothetical protein